MVAYYRKPVMARIVFMISRCVRYFATRIALIPRGLGRQDRFRGFEQGQKENPYSGHWIGYLPVRSGPLQIQDSWKSTHSWRLQYSLYIKATDRFIKIGYRQFSIERLLNYFCN